ncbi:MAG: DUF4445 domain-containing protein [Magnetococcales bacterium]|nr:DUF4445 domain-containing protein [Magnetococcales bacterium]
MTIHAPLGQSIREILDATQIRVRASCGGTGSCGACVVKLVQGKANPLTTVEYLKILPENRDRGERLACQLRPMDHCVVQIDCPAPPFPWHSIPSEKLIQLSQGIHDLKEPIYGLAVDLGTTHIRISLLDRQSGRRIGTRIGANPQGVFGSDVLNRLDASRRHGAALEKLALDSVLMALKDILVRDVGEVSAMLPKIGQVLISGNTAMLTLLTGQGVETLLDPTHWQKRIVCRPGSQDSWRQAWSMPNAQFLLPDPVGGFVGSDLVADLIAVDLIAGPTGSMLLDIGTNTEMALWDGKALHVTSVPGGPAFEGMGLKNGMPAENGAIYRVTLTGDPIAFQVIGNGSPLGFCGSGLVDIVAVLLSQGILKSSGRFNKLNQTEGFPLIPSDPRTVVTGRDIDTFQRAKAAMAAAMETLLMEAGMAWEDLTRLVICGAFGKMLNFRHAVEVGLLPELKKGRYEMFEHGVLAGCECVLLHPDGLKLFESTSDLITLVNLSMVPDYEKRYIDHLRLRPIINYSSSKE